VARAASVTGSAVLSNPSSAVTLTPGYILSPGDRIDTRGGGRVVIDLSDGSMVVVSPESVVVLKDYRAAASLRELFEITLGAVRVKINHFAGKPNPYRMNSPTASIAVRGTEFTIQVGAQGTTQVDVIEGLVEVSALADPARSVLLEAGRGVLVLPGQEFRLMGANQPPPGNRNGDERAGPQNGGPKQGPQQAQQAPPDNNKGPARGPDNHADPGVPPPQQPQQPPVPHARNEHDRDHDQGSQSAAGAYDRYLAGLADIGQAPFLLRFNALSDSHLDALENPAYATRFATPEGRILFMPTFRGTRTLADSSGFGPGVPQPGDFSITPQLSFWAPAGSFTLGGAAGYSRSGESSGESNTGNFFSGALAAARRWGANSLGVELGTLRGSGSRTAGHVGPPGTTSDSQINQTRLTAGYSRALGATTTIGAFYRYGFIQASDRDSGGGPTSTRTSGHSGEAGIRLRGMLTPRLYYGAAAAYFGVSLLDGLRRSMSPDGHARDRAHRGSIAFGMSYAAMPRTVLTFDVAGGGGRTSIAQSEDFGRKPIESGAQSSRFAGFHAAMQHDLTRRIFLNASFLNVWRSQGTSANLFQQDPFFSLASTTNYAARFSDYGAGWRFAPNLYVQYLFSTDYGVTSATHAIMLRWTFRPKGN
jgi:hypothetical protein